MGLSLATRAITLTKERQSPSGSSGEGGEPGGTRTILDASATVPSLSVAGGAGAVSLPPQPHLSDLIHTGDTNGKPIPSIVKAQMFFWTCLVIVLFCVKSVLDGILWDVPWQLVTVMGMSQTTYMLPKFLDKPK